MTARGIRETESKSIRMFLQHHADFLRGDVLDYGCGTQPYKTLIEESGGVYHGFDRNVFPGRIEGVGNVGSGVPNVLFDTVVCTQVIQYVDDAPWLLRQISSRLKTGGVLLLTGPGNWPEVEPDDIVRYTRSGIEHYLTVGGWEDVVVHNRHGIAVNDIRLSLGWAAWAVKP